MERSHGLLCTILLYAILFSCSTVMCRWWLNVCLAAMTVATSDRVSRSCLGRRLPRCSRRRTTAPGDGCVRLAAMTVAMSVRVSRGCLGRRPPRCSRRRTTAPGDVCHADKRLKGWKTTGCVVLAAMTIATSDRVSRSCLGRRLPQCSRRWTTAPRWVSLCLSGDLPESSLFAWISKDHMRPSILDFFLMNVKLKYWTFKLVLRFVRSIVDVLHDSWQ